MSNPSEILTIRLPLSSIRSVEQYAKDNGMPKSKAAAELINLALKSQEDISQKILIELLMIMRSTIKNEKAYQQILLNIDEFKQAQGLDPNDKP